MSSQILTKLRTKDDLDILKGELSTLENAIYHTDINYEDVLRNDIRSWVSEIIRQESSGADLEKYIKNLRSELESVPIVSASISFEPSANFIERISGWLKSNVNKQIVIDLMLNSSSLGGIQLSYRGKYLDLSLRKRLSVELDKVTLTGSGSKTMPNVPQTAKKS